MNSGKRAFTTFFFGGLLPVIAFTVIEEKYGTVWGIVAGMIFGVGDIVWEWTTQKKISAITLGANGLILVLGLVSLYASEGIWFKMQPAIMEFIFAALLIVSFFLKKPFLLSLMEKQGQVITPLMRTFFPGLTFRIGVFFLFHAVLATWAALNWSTSAWAFLKGIGFTVSFVVYIVIEMWLQRRRTLHAPAH